MYDINHQINESPGTSGTGRPGLRARVLAGSVCLITAMACFSIGAPSASATTHAKPSGTTAPRPSHAAPTAGGPMYNNGGPVQTGPRYYLVLWGWTSDPAGEAGYLQNFLGAVGGTSWLNTVSQYGAGAGSYLAGSWSDPSGVPSVPTDAQIQNEASSAAAHFGVGSGDINAQIIVATPTGHSTSGFGSSYCAYHGVIGGTGVTYTDLPYMPDAGGSCGAGSVTGSSLDGVSIVEGHELAEAITDPELNAWYDSSGAEIGDICAWQNLQVVGLNGGSYPMQPLWSNASNSCVQGS